jgi:uncharacterized membrane protein YphA (DoxX/SURF4 family)
MLSDLSKLDSTRTVLRIVYGLVPIVAGLDKFFNILTTWGQYLNPTMARFQPFSTLTFMHIVGVIEIIAGIIVLSRFTTVGAYIVAIWLALIALTLIASGRYLDVAVRDIVMALGAYTLGVLNSALARGRLSDLLRGEERLRASA